MLVSMNDRNKKRMEGVENEQLPEICKWFILTSYRRILGLFSYFTHFPTILIF